MRTAFSPRLSTCSRSICGSRSTTAVVPLPVGRAASASAPGDHVHRPEVAFDTDAVSILQGGRVPAESHVNPRTIGTELRGQLVSV